MKAYSLVSLACGACYVALPAPVQAQVIAKSTPSAEQSSPSVDEADIVVTARRRDETLLSVPVVVSAVGGVEMQNRGIVSLEGIARIVPQLIVGPSSGTAQGGAIGLRGISAGDGNNFGDQAVAFSFDGVLVARSSVRLLSQFDLQQVEVLKGPQALFYGKNSPGGVVVIHSQDPTPGFEAGGTLGYEINAREVRGEAYVSGPIASGLGGRLALVYSNMQGWVTNQSASSPIYGPTYRRLPKNEEFDGRLTLAYNQGDKFRAKLKVNYGQFNSSGFYSNTQRVYCPAVTTSTTVRQRGADDCTANDTVTLADMGPAPGRINPVFGDGTPFGKQKQALIGLEMSYDLGGHLTLSSQSGFYSSNVEDRGQTSIADITAASFFVTYQHLKIKEYSQEVRLTSNFGGIFDFMIGGYAQRQNLSNHLVAFLYSLPTDTFSTAASTIDPYQKTSAYSGFINLTLRPAETLELSGGGRYSYEKKSFEAYYTGPFGVDAPAYLPTTRPNRSFDDFSPEVTLTWRPSRNATIFGSYRRGFLSGGFNPGGGSIAAFAGDRSYDAQTVKGFEIGAKGRLLDGKLRANLAAYTYQIGNQQVTSILLSQQGTISQSITNAATSISKGIEFDFNFNPVPDLTLHGGASYNKARYSTFNTSPCYTGQSFSAGCNGNPTPAGVGQLQDLSGARLVRAPDWGISMGAGYDHRFENRSMIGFSVDGNYSSGYFTDATDAPGSWQKEYWLLDASARYTLANGIGLAIVGRNLTNTYYFQRTSSTPFTGSSGTTGTAVGIPGDAAGYVSRGREIVFQVRFALK